MQVDKKRLIIHKLLGDLSSNGQHRQSSILKFVGNHVGEAGRVTWSPSKCFNLGISASSGGGLNETKELKTSNDCESQSNEPRIRVKSREGGSSWKVFCSPVGTLGTLLRGDETKERHHGETSVHDFAFPESPDFSLRLSGRKVEGVEESNRWKGSFKAVCVLQASEYCSRELNLK